jgi:hypothetical protein
MRWGTGAKDIAMASLGVGYRAGFLTAAALTAISAVASWLLVRSSDTAPVPRSVGSNELIMVE